MAEHRKVVRKFLNSITRMPRSRHLGIALLLISTLVSGCWWKKDSKPVVQPTGTLREVMVSLQQDHAKTQEALWQRNSTTSANHAHRIGKKIALARPASTDGQFQTLIAELQQHAQAVESLALINEIGPAQQRFEQLSATCTRCHDVYQQKISPQTPAYQIPLELR